MPSDNSRLFLRGALILTIAATIIKILSAVYRVPFQNIVGDTGFYIYQQVYPIYGIAIALATYGFPVIISKMVADAKKVNASDAHSIAFAALIILGFIGIILFSFFYFGSHIIAHWMGDRRLVPLIKVVAVPFLVMPLISTIRGYFQGKREMLPTAVSQVVEQFIRVICILLLSYVLVRNGATLYQVGRSAFISSVVGSLLAAAILLFFYFRHKEEASLQLGQAFKFIGKKFIIQGIAVCISGALLVLLQLIDSFNLYSLLTSTGIPSEKAKVLKGIYDRGQPFIQLGTVVATSFSLTLVPELSSTLQGQKKNLEEKIQLALKVSVVFGLGATIGLISIMEPTNTMLFSNQAGSNVLKVFSISIFFSSMILTINGILQGLGDLSSSAKFIIIGMIIKVFGNYLLIPQIGTMGASVSTIIALFFILLLSIYKIKRGGIHLNFRRFFIRLLVSAGVMAFILQIWTYVFDYFHLTNRIWSLFESLGGVCLGGFCYLYLIGYFKLFREDEVKEIPFGKYLLHKKK